MEIFYQEIWKMKRVKARKRLVRTYKETNSIRKTAKLWGTSRVVVRKWVRRWKECKSQDLEDISRRPRSSPFKTPSHIEEKVVKIREERGYGKRRIAYFLLIEEGIEISERERYFIQQSGPMMRIGPFDAKDIYDKGTLGTKNDLTHTPQLIQNKEPRPTE